MVCRRRKVVPVIKALRAENLSQSALTVAWVVHAITILTFSGSVGMLSVHGIVMVVLSTTVAQLAELIWSGHKCNNATCFECSKAVSRANVRN